MEQEIFTEEIINKKRFKRGINSCNPLFRP